MSEDKKCINPNCDAEYKICGDAKEFVPIQKYQALEAKLAIAEKTLKLISLNKTDDGEIYTMGCDCDEEAIQALEKLKEGE